MRLILKGFSRIIFVMRMILRLIVCVALMGAFILIQTQESSGTTTEKWRCFDEQDYGKKTALVKLTRVTEDGKKSGSGEVLVAGVTHKALFLVEGLNRRWNFGERTKAGLYSYSFVIWPDGEGTYYDFSIIDSGVETQPKLFFNCVSP